MRKIVAATAVLGVLAVVSLVLSLLALTDIGHREPDLTMEWWIVRVAFAILAAFIACALLLVRRVLEREP